MDRSQLEKFALFVGILIVGVAADQWTKWYASKRLAHAHMESGHSIAIRVPPSADGASLRSYLDREFSANSEEQLDRIAEHWVYGPDGVRMDPDETVEQGELLSVAHRTVTVIPGFFDFEYAENRGAAFSFLADTNSPYRLPFLIGFSALALLVIVYFLSTLPRGQTAMVWALSFVATGAVGNLIDRVRLGYVIDFILWKYGNSFRWPNFNLADTFISVGVVLMLIGVIFGADEPSQQASVEE